MGVESDADLAGFFDPAEFGTRLIVGGVEFHGIDTTGMTTLTPAEISAGIPQVVPRIICRRADLPSIQQGDIIEVLEATPHNAVGAMLYVNDLQFKGGLLVIHYHTGY